MAFYKNVDLIREGDTYYLLIKVNDMITEKIKMSPDRLEYIISKYREVKY